MTWEYRIFFIPSNPNAKVLQADHIPNSDIPRTDQYYAHSADVGIKKRGGKALELKLRSKVDDNGFERWEKWRISNFEELKTILSEKGYSDSSILTEEALVVVSVGKSRRIGFREGMQMEETDLLVQRERGKDDSTGGADEMWKTVSVEGNRKACNAIMNLLPKMCRDCAINGDIRECGYAEFVSDFATGVTGVKAGSN